MEDLTIKAEFIFEFTSMSKWVNKAASWFKPYQFQPTVCLDKNGDVCHIGEDFMNAEKKDLFPIKVYRLKRAVEKCRCDELMRDTINTDLCAYCGNEFRG